MYNLKNLKQKAAVNVAAATALLLSTMVAAHAEIDAAVGTAFTAVKADATSLMTLVTPIVIAILGMFITLKLIKKFGNKI